MHNSIIFSRQFDPRKDRRIRLPTNGNDRTGSEKMIEDRFEKCPKKTCPCEDWKECNPARMAYEEKIRAQNNGCEGRTCPCGMNPNCPNRIESENKKWKARREESVPVIMQWYGSNFRNEIKIVDVCGNG